MRILLITDGIYPYQMGGMQKHSYYLAKYLAKNKMDVCVAHCRDAKDQSREEEHPAFENFNLDFIDFRSFVFPSCGNLPGHYIKENKLYSKAIFEGLKKEIDNYDIIYAQGFTAYEFIRQSKKGKLKVPIVSNLHGLEMFQRAPSPKVKLTHLLLRRITKFVSTQSDYVFSFGGEIKRINSELGISAEKIFESPIGIEEDWLTDGITDQNSSVRNFVFVGRAERRKGTIELRSALLNLLDNGRHPFHFHFVGPVPEEEKISDPSITYYGLIRDENRIKEILKICDVMVCPSYSEGMPTVIMEAMASGLALIATDVGAVNEQVSNNGWLLKNSSTTTIQDAMIEAITLPSAELKLMKSASLSKVKKHFVWDDVVKHKIACLQDMISNTGNP
ncbi:MAG: glycosyltransferase family 4 protein [Crocinitomicaceae bacterium]|jgi:glycosyltransferase involved in cell wall biosynthesis|nr:glycosyltransferase family 4 protein [Crocinitomicaceae bacterium]